MIVGDPLMYASDGPAGYLDILVSLEMKLLIKQLNMPWTFFS